MFSRSFVPILSLVSAFVSGTVQHYWMSTIPSIIYATPGVKDNFLRRFGVHCRFYRFLCSVVTPSACEVSGNHFSHTSTPPRSFREEGPRWWRSRSSRVLARHGKGVKRPLLGWDCRDRLLRTYSLVCSTPSQVSGKVWREFGSDPYREGAVSGGRPTPAQEINDL